MEMLSKANSDPIQDIKTAYQTQGFKKLKEILDEHPNLENILDKMGKPLPDEEDWFEAWLEDLNYGEAM